MDTPKAVRPDTVPQALGRLRVVLEDAFTRASRELGLTPQQAELLCAAITPAAVGDLAQVLRCDRSNVSRLVDRAAARGLLERRGADLDGRVSLVQLTDEGDVLARRFITALEDQLADLLDNWSQQRQRSVVRLMNEIADTLDARRAAPVDRRRNYRSPQP